MTSKKLQAELKIEKIMQHNDFHNLDSSLHQPSPQTNSQTTSDDIELGLPLNLKTMDTNILVEHLENKMKQREKSILAKLKR